MIPQGGNLVRVGIGQGLQLSRLDEGVSFFHIIHVFAQLSDLRAHAREKNNDQTNKDDLFPIVFEEVHSLQAACSGADAPACSALVIALTIGAAWPAI